MSQRPPIPLPRHRALAILGECTGDDLWSVEHCRSRGVPEAWVAELADAYESNFDRDSQTIYVGERTTNQYHGVRDVELAIYVARSMRLDVERITALALGRRGVVQAIKQAVVDGE